MEAVKHANLGLEITLGTPHDEGVGSSVNDAQVTVSAVNVRTAFVPVGKGHSFD